MVDKSGWTEDKAQWTVDGQWMDSIHLKIPGWKVNKPNHLDLGQQGKYTLLLCFILSLAFLIWAIKAMQDKTSLQHGFPFNEKETTISRRELRFFVRNVLNL